MDFQFDDDTLTITVDAEEQAELQQQQQSEPDFGSDQSLWDHFESLICNSELQWINPADTGDLTDAPLLGILGDESTENTGPYGAVHVGHWDERNHYQPILKRWGYMSYQLRSPLDDLAQSGKVVFQASW
jgi:hypothetical protein